MRRWLAAVAVGACALGLSACGGATITSGVVTAKKYTPAHSGFYEDPIPHQTCEPVGKVEDCYTTYTYMLMPRNYPASWQVQVRNGNKTQWLTVKESVYHTLSKGEYYRQ